jgi:hypothetical protein
VIQLLRRQVGPGREVGQRLGVPNEDHAKSALGNRVQVSEVPCPPCRGRPERRGEDENKDDVPRRSPQATSAHR